MKMNNNKQENKQENIMSTVFKVGDIVKIKENIANGEGRTEDGLLIPIQEELYAGTKGRITEIQYWGSDHAKTGITYRVEAIDIDFSMPYVQAELLESATIFEVGDIVRMKESVRDLHYVTAEDNDSELLDLTSDDKKLIGKDLVVYYINTVGSFGSTSYDVREIGGTNTAVLIGADAFDLVRKADTKEEKKAEYIAEPMVGFSAGDKVKIKDVLTVGRIGGLYCSTEMTNYAGKTVTIKEKDYCDNCDRYEYLTEETGDWHFNADMLDGKVKDINETTETEQEEQEPTEMQDNTAEFKTMYTKDCKKIVKQKSYKVGDKIKIREDLKVGSYNSTIHCNSDMLAFAGNILTVRAVEQERVEDGYCYHTVEGDVWWFSTDMIEGKVVNNPITLTAYTIGSVDSVEVDTIFDYIKMNIPNEAEVEKVIINDNVVIAFVNHYLKSYKVVAKCHESDNFNIVNGAEVAGIKAGIKIYRDMERDCKRLATGLKNELEELRQ